MKTSFKLNLFQDKIEKIRNGLQEQNTVCDVSDNQYAINSILSSFAPATEAEIVKLINKSASKSCDLDPIPTWLLKLCLDPLLPVITHIVNVSLSTSDK